MRSAAAPASLGLHQPAHRRACDNENALLAAILADATNLGLARMAEASQGVTRDQLVWTADAYIRQSLQGGAGPDHRRPPPPADLGRMGRRHHISLRRPVLPLGQAGRGAGEVNARYGVDPGLASTPTSPTSTAPITCGVISATGHEAPYVLDGLCTTAPPDDRHPLHRHRRRPDHVFILCAMLGFRFCPRLRDFPTAGSPASSRRPPTRTWPRCSAGGSGRTSSASTGARCCAWSRR